MGCDQEQFLFFLQTNFSAHFYFQVPYVRTVKTYYIHWEKKKKKETHMSNMSRVSKRKRKTYN
jgi:hypothetical protein